MSDLRDYILSKLQEMVKAPKKKVEPKKPVKTEPSHEDQEDFAKWQDENNPMSNVQQEAIDFSKKTIAGKAARKTAAGALKAVKSRFQQAGLAKKPGDAAKLTKQYSQETYKQRESTDFKDRMVAILLEKKKVNPWAVCHASTGPEKSDKFERCVMDVKKKHGIKEGTLADRLVNMLAEAFTGTTDLNMEYHGKKQGKAWATGSRANMLKKSRTLSSVVNKQPSVQKARADAKAEDAKKPKPASGGHKPSGPKRTPSGSYFRHRSGKDVEI